MNYRLLTGDNRQTLKTIADNSIDAVVTDPPYGIDFLGKSWDANTGAVETYQECLRVLKPGGHILAFSAARTYHHLAVTLEAAGFEIRDQIMWIYSSGFPKSQDVGRQLHKKQHGKPDKQRFDPAVMIKIDKDQYRHPDSDKIYRALPDINGDRLAVAHEGEKYGTVYEQVIEVESEWSGWGTQLKPAHEPICLARKPLGEKNIAANCLKWGTGAINIDATRVPYSDSDDIETYLNNKRGPMERAKIADGENIGMFDGGVGYKAIKREVTAEQDLPDGRFPSNVIGEISDYQKYFYCPKVSSQERHIMNTVQNTHPTVKPIELMKYLIRLITPPGGTVLDPFNGSGSTGCAAVELGHPYIGCELDEKYVDIAWHRIRAWYQHTHPNTYNQLFEKEQ